MGELGKKVKGRSGEKDGEPSADNSGDSHEDAVLRPESHRAGRLPVWLAEMDGFAQHLGVRREREYVPWNAF
jgi:hypothetical protein